MGIHITWAGIAVLSSLLNEAIDGVQGAKETRKWAMKTIEERAGLENA